MLCKIAEHVTLKPSKGLMPLCASLLTTALLVAVWLADSYVCVSSNAYSLLGTSIASAAISMLVGSLHCGRAAQASEVHQAADVLSCDAPPEGQEETQTHPRQQEIQQMVRTMNLLAEFDTDGAEAVALGGALSESSSVANALQLLISSLRQVQCIVPEGVRRLRSNEFGVANEETDGLSDLDLSVGVGSQSPGLTAASAAPSANSVSASAASGTENPLQRVHRLSASVSASASASASASVSGGASCRKPYIRRLTALCAESKWMNADHAADADRMEEFSDAVVHAVRSHSGCISHFSADRIVCTWGNRSASNQNFGMAACQAALGAATSLGLFDTQRLVPGITGFSVVAGQIHSGGDRRYLISGSVIEWGYALVSLGVKLSAPCIVPKSIEQTLSSLSVRPVATVCGLENLCQEEEQCVVYAVSPSSSLSAEELDRYTRCFEMAQAGNRTVALELIGFPSSPLSRHLHNILQGPVCSTTAHFAGWQFTSAGAGFGKTPQQTPQWPEWTETTQEKEVVTPRLEPERSSPSVRPTLSGILRDEERTPQVEKSVHELALALTVHVHRPTPLWDASSESRHDTFQSDGVHYIMTGDELGRGACGVVKRCLRHDGKLFAAKVLPIPVEAFTHGAVRAVTKDSDGRIGIVRKDGTRIRSVQGGGPADLAGLMPGMEIISIEGVPTRYMDKKPSEQPDVGAMLRDAPTTFRLAVVCVEKAKNYVKAFESVCNMYQEATMLCELESEHIVSLETCTILKNECVLVMELQTGGSLLSILRSVGRLPITCVQSYACDMVCGLEFLHGRGVEHRDFKTANVLLSATGRCKLTDFGCSHRQALEQGSKKRREKAAAVVVGTPLYLSPEAAAGRPTTKSDIWSLGVVVSELVTGEAPYAGEELAAPQALAARLSTGLLRPRLPRQVTFLVRRFVTQCWAAAEEDRPTAAELLKTPFLNQPGYRDRIPTPVRESSSSSSVGDLRNFYPEERKASCWDSGVWNANTQPSAGSCSMSPAAVSRAMLADINEAVERDTQIARERQQLALHELTS